MLKKSKELTKQEQTRNVYIGPDLTRNERLANKVLRDELKARRQREETRLLIRNNTIVTAAPQTAEGQAVAGQKTDGTAMHGRRDTCTGEKRLAEDVQMTQNAKN